MSAHSIKPQDVLVACQLAILGNKPATHAWLSETLHLSSSTVFASLKSLKFAKLVTTSGSGPRVAGQRLLEFLVYGVPTLYYPQKTEIVRGVATAVFSPHFRERFTAGKDLPVVWPYSKGKETGEGLVPLYPSIPIACSKNPDLYQLMATIEILRIGKAREKDAAISYLEELFDVLLPTAGNARPSENATVQTTQGDNR